MLFSKLILVLIYRKLEFLIYNNSVLLTHELLNNYTSSFTLSETLSQIVTY